MAGDNGTVADDAEAQLLVVHVHHTGSHALCQALGRMTCAVADCAERYEKQFQFSRLFDAPSRPRARVVATLARAGPGDVRALRGGRGGRSRAFLVLLREDRLRWALSVACDHNATERCAKDDRNPQFLRRVGGYALARRNYDVAKVYGLADAGAGALWRTQVAVARALAADGARVAFATYERFLAAGPAVYAAKIAAFAVGAATAAAPYAAGCTTYDVARQFDAGGGHKVQVQKVHPEDIRTFVSNHAELYAAFDARPLPTLADVLRRDAPASFAKTSAVCACVS